MGIGNGKGMKDKAIMKLRRRKRRDKGFILFYSLKRSFILALVEGVHLHACKGSRERRIRRRVKKKGIDSYVRKMEH